MTPEVYAVIAARRIVRGLPVLPKTHPDVTAIARDPEIQRRAVVIKRETDRLPPLTDEQAEKLRGLLPAIPRANRAAQPRRKRRKPPRSITDPGGAAA